jgi:hypothetical protein
MNINGVQGNPYQGLTQTRPYDFGTDAIERQRVSLGQSLIDADFEYGLQATKWQTYQELRRFPSFFEIPGSDIGVSNVQSDGSTPSTMTVYASNVAPAIGSVISIQGLSNLEKNADRAEGFFLVTTSNPTTNVVTYTAKGLVSTTTSSNVQSSATVLRRGNIFNSGAVKVPVAAITADTNPGTNVAITTTYAHGLMPGTPLTANSSGFTFNGNFFVSNVTSANTFNVVATSTVTVATAANSNLYMNPYSYAVHRPFDGGVLISPAQPSYGAAITRQSKKVFRYQSGKGLLWSSGTLFAPNNDLASVNVYGLSTTLTSNSNGLTGVSLTVANPTLLGLYQNVTFTPSQTTFLYSNVSNVNGNVVTFVYNGTFPTSLPTAVTQNTITTSLFTPSAVYVPFANTTGFSGTNFPVNIAGFGTFNVASVATNSYLTLGNWPYASIPSGTLISNATVAGNITGNTTAGATLISPLNVPVSSTNGFVLGETVTFSSAPATLGTFAVTSNSSQTTLGLSYTGTANTAQTIASFTTITGVPVSITSAGPHTVNVGSVAGFSNGQTIANYMGAGLGQLSITGTGTVASNAQITFTNTGSFPTGGISINTPVTVIPPGSNIQLVTAVTHGVPQAGAAITVKGITTANVNGSYTVASVVDSKTLNVTSTSAITSFPIVPADQPRFIMSNWHGASVRAGCFDDQNGVFWEYDGQTLFVVRRSSTFQITGTANTNVNSQILYGTLTGTTGTLTGATTTAVNIGDVTATITVASHTVQVGMYTTNLGGALAGLGVCWVLATTPTLVTIGFLPTTVALSGTPTGTGNFVLANTRFLDQLKVNDKITIKGMTHQITSIQGQGVLTFNPPYRGAANVPTNAPATVCKIKETRVPQSQFNRDTIDGNGPSGFKVDLSKMQMTGIQYTWYGAGFIDFMMRGSDGNWVYAHRIKNNNINDESYMRTGNMPVRYELVNECQSAVGSLSTAITPSQTTIPVNEITTYFPPSGTLMIDSEFVSYTGKTANTFTGCTRQAPLSYNVSDIPRVFTGQVSSNHLSNTTVSLISATCTPSLTHWGSAFLIDGNFDSDRGYYFNYANVAVSLTASLTATAPAFAIRLAPSVSNGITGDIGARDLLNRAQVLLQKLEVTSTATVTTVGYLNPSAVTFNTANWITVNSQGGQPSFAQIYPGNLITGLTSSTTAPGGERIFQSIVQGNNQNNLDLSGLKEMTNAIIGGNQPYPDGPDVLLIMLQNNTASSVTGIAVNLFWTEAQA